MSKNSVVSGGGGGGNGGIFGSGIFGMFGTTIHCNSTDDSMYCNVMKLFNLLIILLIVGVVGYFAYTYFFPSSSRKGGSRK